MRSILISTEVFAAIWANRLPGEESENDVLKRIFDEREEQNKRKAMPPATSSNLANRGVNKVKWRDDVLNGLKSLGGKAYLPDIYLAVRRIRENAGRSLPKSFEAIVRRELEYNSSDSNAFTGQRDLFRSVNGIGHGLWEVR